MSRSAEILTKIKETKLKETQKSAHVANLIGLGVIKKNDKTGELKSTGKKNPLKDKEKK